jgi:hypothetical protein
MSAVSLNQTNRFKVFDLVGSKSSSGSKRGNNNEPKLDKQIEAAENRMNEIEKK